MDLRITDNDANKNVDVPNSIYMVDDLGCEGVSRTVKKRRNRRKKNTSEWLEECINEHFPITEAGLLPVPQMGEATNGPLIDFDTHVSEGPGAEHKKKRTRSRHRKKNAELTVTDGSVPIINVMDLLAELNIVKDGCEIPEREEQKEVLYTGSPMDNDLPSKQFTESAYSVPISPEKRNVTDGSRVTENKLLDRQRGEVETGLLIDITSSSSVITGAADGAAPGKSNGAIPKKNHTWSKSKQTKTSAEVPEESDIDRRAKILFNNIKTAVEERRKEANNEPAQFPAKNDLNSRVDVFFNDLKTAFEKIEKEANNKPAMNDADKSLNFVSVDELEKHMKIAKDKIRKHGRKQGNLCSVSPGDNSPPLNHLPVSPAVSPIKTSNERQPTDIQKDGSEIVEFIRSFKSKTKQAVAGSEIKNNASTIKDKHLRTRNRQSKKCEELSEENDTGEDVLDIDDLDFEDEKKRRRRRRRRPKKNKEITNESIQNNSPSKSSPKQENVNVLIEISDATAATPRGDTARSPKDESSKKKKKSPSSKQHKFDPYMKESDVMDGLQRKILVEGILRINQKNFTEAYISSPDNGPDILINSVKDRNRALEGDEVVILLKSPEDWKTHHGHTQKTGVVVYIRSKNHSRAAIGILKLMPDKNEKFALFSPRDSRVPRMMIPMENCPPNFYRESEKYSDKLMLVKITRWENYRFALGEILEIIGTQGDPVAETVALLKENDIDTSPYPDSLLSYVPSSPYPIPEEEIQKRRDFRKDCVFTIDPVTAKDLDDAVSCKELPNGNLEIGVHISDVTHYLEEGSPLDEAVAKKATSTYLVTAVYHMLPVELCRMCSLLPGEDRLAFSVVWEMTKEGEIVSKEFTRSVIRSCAQLSYEHAQEILQTERTNWTRDEIPVVGDFKPSDICRIVRSLNHIALNLRSKRFSGGALRIDQPKLLFKLSPDTGVPIAFFEYVQMESHRLIEEFMLLANMSVAERLKEIFPTLAFLRFHPEPHNVMMCNLQECMQEVGIHLDISSAGALNESLIRYSGDDIYSKGRTTVLNALCARPMCRAKYFCVGTATDDAQYWHYALNVGLYTHFTSPIRRYADVMVHRLLAASLGYSTKPNWTPEAVQKIAENCNRKKYDAKRAGEVSTELYLSMYVGLYGPMKEEAVVMTVKSNSLDVIVLRMGCVVRVYVNNLEECIVTVLPQNKISIMEIQWKPNSVFNFPFTQTIQMFSIITVAVMKSTSTQKIEATLLHPKL